jgi:hypothetical protein
MGNVYLQGRDKDLWSSEEWRKDLVCVRYGVGDDVFFQWLHDTAIHWYHRLLGRHINVKLIPNFKILADW